MCAPCFAETPEEVERAKRVKADAAQRYFNSGAARDDLLTAGVTPAAVQWVEIQREQKKGLFGRGGQYEEVEVVIRGYGWILGEFRWQEWGDTNDLTALLDVAPSDRRYLWGLVCVQRVSEGYERYGLQPGIGHPESDEALIKAAQAVKRLTGESI